MTAVADPGPLAEHAPARMAGLDRPRVEVDMRCSTSTTHGGSPVRCQLLAGHDGVHAVMYCAADRRRVLTWDECGTCGGDADESWAGRPWMRGYPFPAWFEAPGTVPGPPRSPAG